MLEVQHLYKTFSTGGRFFTRSGHYVHAVTDVSFTVDSGNALAIVGESGSGKTTIARCLVRLHQPDSGSICINGKDIVPMTGSEFAPLRESVQYVFQNPYSSLNPRMNMLQALSEPFHGRKNIDIKGRVLAALDSVGMGADALHKYPHEFSGGQRQRLSVARALMLDPDVLVLDEPVSSLDVSIQGQILNLLLELKKKKNIAFVLISHNLAVVRQIADTILVLYLGHVVEYGNAEKVFANPRHPYTRSLLASVPGRSGELQVLQGEVPSNIHPPAGCPFHPRCPVSARPESCFLGMPPLEGKDGHYCACYAEE